jgi:hypothetical protein
MQLRLRAIAVPLALAAALGATGGQAASAAAAAPKVLQVSTSPKLFPERFRPSVRDYVVRCGQAGRVRVAVSAPRGTSVSVDRARERRGSFRQTVTLEVGQSFEIVARPGQRTRSYSVRCLPSDFPRFWATRSGQTQAKWYALAPNMHEPRELPPGVSHEYAALFDNNGVPVWWMRSAGHTKAKDVKLLPNGNIAWMHLGRTGMEEHRLDGSMVRTLNTVGTGADAHDLQLAPNGNYLMGRYFDRFDVDMSSCGGSKSRKLIDFELQELTPEGELVWSWRASDHIPFTEITKRWRFQCTTGSGDIYHWNSVEPDGGGYVLSFRHLDAVYRIERSTGAIDWKLGGERRAQSLKVVGDPLSRTSTFGAQHDARVLRDGTITVHDNGGGYNRPPRATRFAINESRNTARLLEDVRDPQAPRSTCCGSSRRLPGGNWVSAWGANPYVTEQKRNGERVFKLSFAQELFSYTANPVLPGQLSQAALRAGMDAQHPRP